MSWTTVSVEGGYFLLALGPKSAFALGMVSLELVAYRHPGGSGTWRPVRGLPEGTSPELGSTAYAMAAIGNDRALVHAYLDCEVSLGRHGGPWQVEESTLPFREGGSAWDGSETRLMDNGASLLQENGLGRFRWRIVESSEPVDRLPSLIDR